MGRTRTAMFLAAVLALAACGEADDTTPGGADTVQENPPVTGSAPSDPDDTTRPPAEPPTTRVADPMDGGTVVPPTEPAPAGDPPLTVRDDLPTDDLPTDDVPGPTLPPPTADVEVPPPGGPAEQARADLASRLGVPVEDVVVVSAEEVTWSDGSLGCPRPGMSYTQALVNGTRIVLEVGGATYEYHSGETAAPFHCPNPTPPADSGGVGDV